MLIKNTLSNFKKKYGDIKINLRNKYIKFKIKNKFNENDRYYNYMYINTKIIHGKNEIKYRKNEAIVLCLVRDGETWIKDFIEHYRRLGFKHIVFLDNGSKDKTIEIAKKHKNITILKTNVPFKGNNIFLRRCLVKRFAEDKWSLTADIDELWNYPYSEKIPLSKFLEYLNKQGANVVVAQMLDMFQEKIPEKKIPLASYNLYDVSDFKKFPLEGMCPHGFKYDKILNKSILYLEGGIRKTLFDAKGVWLTKMPLLFNNSILRPLRHQHFSNRGVIADVSTVLLHYKFTENFKEKIDDALKEKQYCGDSVDYKKYAEVMYKNPLINLKTKNSKKLENINQLIDDKFIVVSNKYKKWVEDNTQ
ncbi:glycosyltransferase family 2 protein [Candidatus Woesearchaeota archaeon]|nr:glycosyltransferase family 2 protein [Candidatus Woesearchaeota archaeon]